MNNMALEGSVNQEDVLKMVENDYTIEIPNHALEKGKMLPYLRSLTRYIDRQPITKFRSSAFKFAEEDFDLNVAANVTTKKFHGFKNSPEVSSEEKTTARAFATVIVWRRDCWRRFELTKAGITPTIVIPARVFTVVFRVLKGFGRY